MATNELIARGITPLGEGVDRTLMNLQQLQQGQQRNALASRSLDANIAQDNTRNALYERQIGAQEAGQKNALSQQKQEDDKRWFASAIEHARQDPNAISSLIAQGKQRGSLAADFPDTVTPDQVEQIAMQMGIAPAPKAVPFEQTNDYAKLKMQGDQAARLQQQQAGSAAALERQRAESAAALERQKATLPNAKPPTEGDKKVANLYNSLVNSEKQISEMKGADTSSKWNNALGSNDYTRVFQSNDFKQYEAAGLRWAANLLYIKSGATATPDEIRSTWKQFFPQPGEDQTTKDQKNAARYQEMGSIHQTYTLPGSAPSAPAKGATGGWTITPIS